MATNILHQEIPPIATANRRDGGGIMGCSKESFRILAGCTNSGKSKRGIQKALDAGIRKEFSHQQRLEKLNEFYLDSAKRRIQRVERYREE